MSELIPMYSPMSILSVSGLIMLFISLCILFGVKGKFLGRWSGWLSCLSLTCCMIIMVGAFRPNLSGSLAEGAKSSLAPCLKINGEWKNEYQLMLDEETGKSHYYYPAHKDDIRYYRINAIDEVPCWIWHPDGLWWSPLVALIIGTIVMPFLPSRKN